MNRKLFLYIVLLFVIMAGGIFLLTDRRPPAVEPVAKVDPNEIDKDNLNYSTTSAPLPRPTLSESASETTLTGQAWQILQKYLENAKAHNLANLRTFSHQISDTCNDPAKERECFALMDNVYFIASQFKKEGFKNIWYDSRQIILATDYKEVKEETDQPIYGLIRSVLFFTRTTDGTPRLLSLREFDGAFVKKGDLTDEQVWNRVRELIKDGDEDGLADDTELCLDTETQEEKQNCVSSDPKVRDTDGDGWWDGIEYFFYKR